MSMRIFLLPVTIFFISCQQPGAAGTIANPTEPQKINITKDAVFDLEGYADEGGGDPFKLFDENSFSDPLHESGSSTDFIPVTNPQPTIHPDIYFKPGRGNRIVTRLPGNCLLKEIYLYDRSHNGDSIWLYTGSMNHWKMQAAFISRSDPGQWGWRKFTLDDSSRFVLIRFSSFETAITEMVIYGFPSAEKPEIAARPAAIPPFTRKPIREFLGANCYDETDMRWLQPFHYLRIYNAASDFDNTIANEYPKITFNLGHLGRPAPPGTRYRFLMDDLAEQNGGICWYSIRGVPAWMAKKGYDDKDRPVTSIGFDPESPASYARHANMMWTLAGFFGSHPPSINELSLSPTLALPPKAGLMDLFENGNEEDAWWVGSKYCNPVEYFAQSSADFDGHESTLGKRSGIRNADVAGKLITSGIVGLDTNRIRVYSFLCNALRSDKYFIWNGGIQYHYYCTDGKKGLTPEEDSLRIKLSKVSGFTHRLQPGIDCMLGENGYDKGQSQRQATPLIPGLSAAECQAIFILRSINATAFSGFDRYILYWLKDRDPEDDPRVYLTSGVIRQFPDGHIQPYPSWFYISSYITRLANYRPDAIISEKGPGFGFTGIETWTTFRFGCPIYSIVPRTMERTSVNDYTLTPAKKWEAIPRGIPFYRQQQLRDRIRCAVGQRKHSFKSG